MEQWIRKILKEAPNREGGSRKKKQIKATRDFILL